MSASVKLYTAGNMEAAICTAAASEATGYPKENLIDNNLDTYWKPTAAVTSLTDYDLVTAKTVNTILVFIKNYTELTACSLDRYWSDNGSSWTFISSSPSMVDSATPIRINELGTDYTHRYWRVTFVSPSHVPKIAGVWFGYKYEVSQGNEFPEQDADRFFSKAVNLPGGRVGIKGINRNSSIIIPRTYLFSGTTEYNALRNAHQDSQGRRVPLVMNEGSAQSDARVVRFADDSFVSNQIDYQLYNPSVRFEQIPFIDDGESY